MMIKTFRLISLLMVLMVLMMTGCANVGKDVPASSVLAYWQAMAKKDSVALSSLTCADYEATALSTLDSFQAVETTLSDLECATVFQDGKTAEVTCQGSLEATYGAEVSSFDLSIYTYQMIQQSGDWLMCGEK